MNVKWIVACKEFNHLFTYWWPLWILLNDKSLSWSRVWFFTPVNSCIALFTSGVTGIGSIQMGRCNLSISRSLVNPPEVFTIYIRGCSITRWIDNPAQSLSLLRMHGTCLRLCCTSGSVWEALTLSVSKFMMTLHISDVLMQQKWHYFMNTLEM